MVVGPQDCKEAKKFLSPAWPTLTVQSEPGLHSGVTVSEKSQAADVAQGDCFPDTPSPEPTILSTTNK